MMDVEKNSVKCILNCFHLAFKSTLFIRESSRQESISVGQTRERITAHRVRAARSGQKLNFKLE